MKSNRWSKIENALNRAKHNRNQRNANELAIESDYILFSLRETFQFHNRSLCTHINGKVKTQNDERVLRWADDLYVLFCLHFILDDEIETIVQT